MTGVANKTPALAGRGNSKFEIGSSLFPVGDFLEPKGFKD